MSTGVSLLADAGGDKIIKKSGAESYAKVFKRKVGGTIQYLWLTTNISGVKTENGGMLKNTARANSLSAAENSIPFGWDNLYPSGTLVTVNQYDTGLTGDSGYQIDTGGSFWYYQPTDYFYPQLSVLPTPDNKVTVYLDTSGFGTGDGVVKFKIENAEGWLTKGELEAIDFSNMKGKDVSIIAAMFSGTIIQETKQSIVHFAGDSSSKMPTFYVRNPLRRIQQFPYLFPAFGLITGKTNIAHFGQLDASFNYKNTEYLTRGFNVLDFKGNSAIPTANRIVASYDEWAYDHGCPTQNWPGAVAWLESKSMAELYGWFNSYVIAPAAGHLACFLDFEAWGFAIADSSNARNKMASLFKAFKAANPTTLLMLYVGSRSFNSSVLGELTLSEMNAQNAKYGQTVTEAGRDFEVVPVTYLNVSTGATDGTSGYLMDYIDVINAGDYQHFISDSWFYSTIQEMELAKLLKPGKKCLPLMWSYIETVPGSDFNSVRRYYRTAGGQVYFTDYKLAVPFSHLFNHAAWGNFIGDGMWNWEGPYNAIEGFDYWGAAGKNPETGALLGTNFSTNLGMMEISTTMGLDYIALALYILKLNEDIVNGTQSILKPEFSVNGGSTYLTGDALKPASADYYKTPIVRIKKHDTLNQWLILAVNRYNEHYNNQTIKVKIPGTALIKDIVLNGQFTTIERIRLT